MMRSDILAQLMMPFGIPEEVLRCDSELPAEPIRPVRHVVVVHKNEPCQCMPEIVDVIYNDPATVVFWADGTKTIVKCQKDKGDVYSKETGLAIAIAKKAYGNTGSFNDVLNKWLYEKQ